MGDSLMKQSGLGKLLRQARMFFEEYRFGLWGSLICGLLAYGYAFTNKLVNLDELQYLFGKGATLESGRWGLVLSSWIFPDYSMPWVYGVMSLLIITAAICVCLHTFRIRTPLLQFLVAGTMITFPSMAATVTYTFTISAYAVSLFLAIMPVYLLSLGGWKRWLMALACCVVSVSIYQAYIAVTASLLILLLIQKVLANASSEKDIFVLGLGFVLFLVASLGIYWLSTKLVWAVTGASAGSYASSALSLNRLDILRNVKNAYASSFRILWSGFYGLIATPVSRFVHLFCGAVLVLEALLWIRCNQKIHRIALLIFLALLLPLSMNCMFLFVYDIMIHSLVMYAFVGLYILTAIVLEQTQFLVSSAGWDRIRKWCCDLVLVGMAVVIAGNVYFANKGYLNLHMQYESSHSFATTVIASLQNTPGFRADSKVAIVGAYDKPQSVDAAFSYLEGIYGLEGINPNTYSFANFFEYYCGVELNFATNEEKNAVRATEAFAQMPVFPGNGSIQEIEGIFVVRLS